MAPAAVQTLQSLHALNIAEEIDASGYKNPLSQAKVDINGPVDETKPYDYPHYLPTWDTEQKYEPLKPYEHVEHGKGADPTFPDLFPTGKETVPLTPKFGTEVRGVQLSKLSPKAKDQLALFTAQRGVVVFRDQDFADLPIQEALDQWGYFGRHHIHPTSGAPKGYPEDVTYENQPPGTTLLAMLTTPQAGGDTLFANMREAYTRLSPLFQERLHGLTANHSAHEQAQFSLLKEGIVRREPIISAHPVVRTHPTTGEKALFVNEQFTRSINGFKKEESDFLLRFLYDHVAKGSDFHLRVHWDPKTVVVWDNRIAVHSALFDWESDERRHAFRIQPQAEPPYETPFVKPEAKPEVAADVTTGAKTDVKTTA